MPIRKVTRTGCGAATCIRARSNATAICATTGCGKSRRGLRDTKPFTQSASRYREELKPGDPVHDIAPAARDRRQHDDSSRREATMRATPYPTCIEVEPILQRLIGERIGSGWRKVVRQQARPARKLHASVGTARPRRDHAVSDHVPRQESGRPRLAGQPARPHRAAVLRRRLPFLAHRRPRRRRHVPAIRDQAGGAGLRTAGHQLSRAFAFTTSACGSPLGRMSLI